MDWKRFTNPAKSPERRRFDAAAGRARKRIAQLRVGEVDDKTYLAAFRAVDQMEDQLRFLDDEQLDAQAVALRAQIPVAKAEGDKVRARLRAEELARLKREAHHELRTRWSK